MLRRGILNAGLAGVHARLGHTHQIVIADAGLPLPYAVPGCTIVDLTPVAGIPRFEQVLDAVLDAIVVDRAEAALESRSHPAHEWIAGGLDALRQRDPALRGPVLTTLRAALRSQTMSLAFGVVVVGSLNADPNKKPNASRRRRSCACARRVRSRP
jgi:D-ribose pyranase